MSHGGAKPLSKISVSRLIVPVGTLDPPKPGFFSVLLRVRICGTQVPSEKSRASTMAGASGRGSRDCLCVYVTLRTPLERHLSAGSSTSSPRPSPYFVGARTSESFGKAGVDDAERRNDYATDSRSRVIGVTSASDHKVAAAMARGNSSGIHQVGRRCLRASTSLRRAVRPPSAATLMNAV